MERACISELSMAVEVVCRAVMTESWGRNASKERKNVALGVYKSGL